MEFTIVNNTTNESSKQVHYNIDYNKLIDIFNNNSISKKQIEKISLLTLEECDKFYPAFQFLAWGEMSAKDSIRNLMLETKGEV